MCAAETGNPKLTMDALARQWRVRMTSISPQNTLAATLAKQGNERVEGRQRGAAGLALGPAAANAPNIFL
jgi:hypothetical protein